MVIIPSTISNNVPGTEFSLGCDTALNEITEVGCFFNTLIFFFSKIIDIYIKSNYNI